MFPQGADYFVEYNEHKIYYSFGYYYKWQQYFVFIGGKQ